MNYRIISKDLLLKLTNKEAYTFCCIVLNADRRNYISHIKQETLVSLTGYSLKSISNYIKKMEKIGLLSVQTDKRKGEKGVFNSNTYYVNKPSVNYFRVEYDFLLENIPADIKGYLLLMKCIGYKGSNHILYSLNKIGKEKLLRIGLSKIKSLNREAIELGTIKKEKDGYRIMDAFIYEDLPKEKAQTNKGFEEEMVGYYNFLVKYFKKKGIVPPKYDKKAMYIIFNHIPDPLIFIKMLKNRVFQVNEIYSLNYLIKALGIKKIQKAEKKESPMLIMT